MISITERVTISRPPEEVFAFACDYRQDPRWRTGVVEMTMEPEGDPALGTKTREVLHFMGQRMVTRAEVVHYERNREIAFQVTDGAIPARGYRRVVSDLGGTHLTYHIEAEPRGGYRLLSPLMRWSFRRRLLQDLQRLKQAIEGRGDGG